MDIRALKTGLALLVALIFPSAVASGTAGNRVSYTTKVFMRGMKVTAPSAQWIVHEDHPGEFNLQAPAGVVGGTHIHFWLDPRAAASPGVLLPKVGKTPAALIAWLRQDHDLVVSAPKPRRIAGQLRAQSVDLDLAATAPREDPGCPGPCLTYFVFKGAHYHFVYGTGRTDPIRLYLATLGHGKDAHTFAVSVETTSPKAFKAVLPTAEKILSSLRLPARISAG
jgi:hypothetical protein